MKTDIISQEIKWCENNRGIKSTEFENGFIAGLKQLEFLAGKAGGIAAVLKERLAFERISAQQRLHLTAIAACGLGVLIGLGIGWFWLGA